MKFLLVTSLLLALAAVSILASAEERRAARSLPVSSEAIRSFGRRSTSETAKSSGVPSSSNSASSSSATTAAAAAASVSKASEKQQATVSEVETLNVAPSSWQLLSAVEAPLAPRSPSDLLSAASDSSFLNQGDFLRSSAATKGGSFRQQQQQQQPSKARQSFFQQQQSKTSNYQAAKTNWYKPSPRPAPIVQQQYEQQSEQYTEQQQVDSAPAGQAEPFAFDFNTQDDSGNGQYRKEESDNNGVVRGSYGFQDASGIYRHVEYVADQNGFRANIKSNEPGVEGGPEQQPASIKLDGRASPAGASGAAPRQARLSSNDQSEWSASSSSSERADLALAPPDFESSHKAERIVRSSSHNFRS